MNEPDYYAGNGLSPLKAFEQGLISKEEYIGFCKGNVIKYTVRAGKKDDALMDIVKAMDYLMHLHKILKENTGDCRCEEVCSCDGASVSIPVNGCKKEFNTSSKDRLQKAMDYVKHLRNGDE